MAADTWMISVDDHVIEPPHVWADRLPAKYLDLGPRWVSDEHGESWLFQNSKRIPYDAMSTNGAIFPPENRAPMFEPLPFATIPAACYDPKARIEAMDTDLEIASLMFPNMPGFAGSLFQKCDDKDLALLCIQAWNDWFLEEWVAAYPGRFISTCMVPLWDGKLAAAEAQRAIDKGAVSITFSQAPHNLGFPAIDDEAWNPLFSLLNDAKIPLCTHLGTGISPAEEEKTADWSAKMRERLKNNDLDTVAAEMAAQDKSLSRRRRMRPGTSTSLIGAKMGHDTLTVWLESGVFARYANLKLVLSENGVGWMPSTLSLSDWTDQLNRLADNDTSDRPKPSELFRDHVYGCFIDEPITPALLDVIGVDNIMIESDFPHTATNWPHSRERINVFLEGIDDESRYKILRGNAERVFSFTPAEQPVLVS